jgi:anti-sigma B factor antagonist
MTIPSSSRAAGSAPPAEFRVDQVDDETVIVAAEGDLDLASAAVLKWTVVKAFRNGRRRAVIDLARVTFIDSTTIGVLVGLVHNLRPDQRLVLGGVGEITRGVFRLAGIERAFELYPTVASALADLDQVDDKTARLTAPPLDRTAGLVLGLAGTAMPFAGSVDEQAERWLRLLRSYGTAALVLASLGISEHPVEHGTASAYVPSDQSDDVAQQVAEQAVRDAAGRRARNVDTTDLLSAVLNVYGDSFERVLRRHGCEGWQLRELLELEHSEALS